jgi:hypothetical protein
MSDLKSVKLFLLCLLVAYIGRLDGDPPGLFWFKRQRMNQWERTITHHDYTTTDFCP